MDYGHRQSDKMLKELEKRLEAEYAQAERELAEKVAQYFKAYERKNAVKLMQLNAGQITEKEYLRWKKGQLLIGQRWQEMQDTIATDLHNVNKIVGAMISTHAKDVYALNHNYGTYEVEKGSMVDTSYTLYNRDTVERLMRDNPDILPPPGKYVSQRIAEGKDVRWNKQQVQSVMTQSILQGESIPKIAKRLEGAVGKSYTEDIIKNADKKTAKQIAKELARKNKAAAIRNARTMTTGAENAGRVDAYKRGQEMGVKSQQMWVATLDSRTRHEHRLLDGQKREVGEPFEIDGEKLRFPGDPTAPPYLVYNCRCGVIAVVKGSKLDKEGIEGIERRDEKLGDMTYDEWKNAKAPSADKPKSEQKPDKGTNTQPEVKKPESEPLSKAEKPLTATDLSKDLQNTLYDYTDGKYKDICDYSQYMVNGDLGKSEYAMQSWEKETLPSIPDKTKKHTEELLSIIDNQPISKEPLVRLEFGDTTVIPGDIISFGIRSASQDPDFITKVAEQEMKGFDYDLLDKSNHGRWREYRFVTSKGIDVSKISAYPDQKETIIAGNYKVIKTEKIEPIKEGYISEIVKIKDVAENTRYFTSKSGKDMVEYTYTDQWGDKKTKTQTVDAFEKAEEYWKRYKKGTFGRTIITLEVEDD